MTYEEMYRIYRKRQGRAYRRAHPHKVGAKDVAVELEYSTISAGTERANLIEELCISAGAILIGAHTLARS